MRYPLWAFFFVLVMPMFTAHALLAGKANLLSKEYSGAMRSSIGASEYWIHRITSR